MIFSAPFQTILLLASIFQKITAIIDDRVLFDSLIIISRLHYVIKQKEARFFTIALFKKTVIF